MLGETKPSVDVMDLTVNLHLAFLSRRAMINDQLDSIPTVPCLSLFFCILIQDYSYPFDHPDNNKQTRLLFVVFDAIAEGNTEVLRDKLQPFSGDINAIRYEDTSPLMWAVLHRRPEVVEMVRISLT